MRAVLYARFSSDNQRQESITAQLRASSEYCDKKGYSIVGTYTDEAQTGTSTVGRDGFQRMINDSSKGLFDVVIFHKIDRAARNERDYYINMATLTQNHVTYEYSAEGIDTTTANGKLTEGIKVAVAAWYSRNLSLEIKKGKKENALEFKHNGGRPAFGYDIDNDNRYIVNEVEAVAVKQIFQLKADGYGYAKIVSWLNAHGYKTKRGGFFGKNSLHDILRNKKYIGVYQYQKVTKHNSHALNPNVVETPDAIPRIIDDELFYRVQKILDSRTGNKEKACKPYLLSGKIFCACGASMVGQSSGTKVHRYHHYICRNKYYKYLPCDTPRLPKEELEESVLHYILSDIKASKQIIIEEFCKLEKNDKARENKKALAQLITKQEHKLNKLLDMYVENDDDEMIAVRYRNAKNELAMLKKEYLAIQEDSEIDVALVEQFLDDILNKELTPEHIKKIFDVFVNKVIAYSDHLDVHFNFKIYDSVVALKRTHPYHKF